MGAGTLPFLKLSERVPFLQKCVFLGCGYKIALTWVVTRHLPCLLHVSQCLPEIAGTLSHAVRCLDSTAHTVPTVQDLELVHLYQVRTELRF